MYYRHTIKYSTLKRNEILTDATTWMNLENTMLSELNQTQKYKYYMIVLICVPRVVKFRNRKLE